MAQTLKLLTADSNSPQPKYRQLAEVLRQKIKQQELQPGDRLPTFAEMRSQHGVTLSTVERVYGLLGKEGLIERRHGSGTYVAVPRRALTGNIGCIGVNHKAPKLPFYQLLMDGMQQSASAERRHVLCLANDDAWNQSVLGKIDGLVLCNIESPEAILRQLPHDLPRVSILTILDDISSVGVDDYRAAQLAVRHLMGFGHRRIVCLMEAGPSEARRRFAGYRDALLDAGVVVDPSWIRLADNPRTAGMTNSYREWGSAQMTDWLQNGWLATNCTAILVQNEVAAIGVMQILQKEGIKVPEQVSVMTFDGTELCDLVSPCLSAVALPLTQIGAKAIELINRQIAGEKSAAQAIMLPLSLRPGESVASAEAAAKQVSRVLLKCR